MIDKETKSETPKEVTRCIGIVQKPDQTFEVRVFILEDAKVVSMEVTTAQDRLEALDAFKILAQRKLLAPIARGQ